MISAAKLSLTVFTMDPKEFNRHPTTTVNGTSLPLVRKPELLGVRFDPLFTFAGHAREVAGKVSCCTKVLVGTSWGCAKETLATTFKVLVKSHLTYAAPIWSPTINSSSLRRLQSALNAALRSITGWYKMLPIDHLHAQASVLPIGPHNALLGQQF
ncbi:unnamed protein product [Dibothriocephalus latus]|uniref:RNA-directed DNA polymerase from mobile element jockey n=1 Tax=Dibothriocephalus latus TaxID=60516 RepID=A0A3P7PRV3_DIBLA|nr:unnamed protein product [Dibothriocephalus latus]